jgi:hypothetical protein
MSLCEDNKAIGVINVVNKTKKREIPSKPKLNWINSKPKGENVLTNW